MNPRNQKLFGLTVSLVIFLAIALAVADTAPWQQLGVGGAEDLDAIVQDLFSDHVIALEVLGILLTAAMIGALVIARPMGAPPDRTHYPVVDEATLQQTMRVSDVGARFAAPSPLALARPESPPDHGGARSGGGTPTGLAGGEEE